MTYSKRVSKGENCQLTLSSKFPFFPILCGRKVSSSSTQSRSIQRLNARTNDDCDANWLHKGDHWSLGIRDSDLPFYTLFFAVFFYFDKSQLFVYQKQEINIFASRVHFIEHRRNSNIIFRTSNELKHVQ